jgi:hypothetical protein
MAQMLPEMNPIINKDLDKREAREREEREARLATPIAGTEGSHYVVNLPNPPVTPTYDDVVTPEQREAVKAFTDQFDMTGMVEDA